MRPLEYSNLALRTATRISACYDFAHAVLGLTSELHEVSEAIHKSAQIVDECGDILWYSALACDTRGILFECVVQEAQNDFDANGRFKTTQAWETMSLAVGNLADYSKKWMIAHRSPDPLKIQTELVSIVTSVISLLADHGYQIWDSMEVNIRKLSIRYPDLKFNADRMMSHNKVAEAEAVRSGIPDMSSAYHGTQRGTFEQTRLSTPYSSDGSASCSSSNSSSSSSSCDSSSTSSDSGSCGGGE